MWMFIQKCIWFTVFMRYVVFYWIPPLLIVFVILFYAVGPKVFPSFYQNARDFNARNVQTSTMR